MTQEELRKRLSSNIKKFRKLKGLSQFELAEKCELSEQTINSIESRRLWPSDKTILKIAEVLEIDVYKLLFPNETDFSYENDILEVRESLTKVVKQLLHDIIEKV